MNDYQYQNGEERPRTKKQNEIEELYLNKRIVEVIPSKVHDIKTSKKKKRVAAYCRVSTYAESQSGSFELQIQSYTEKIRNNREWEFVDVYADQGVSGTSLKG